MLPEEYIEVPVTLNFNMGSVVGSLRILKTAVPPTPEWVLSLGYRVLDNGDGYELKAVSITADSNYKSYLEQEHRCHKTA